MLLKECKYSKKVVIRHITEDIDFFLVTQMKNSFYFNEYLKNFRNMIKLPHSPE